MALIGACGTRFSRSRTISGVFKSSDRANTHRFTRPKDLGSRLLVVAT